MCLFRSYNILDVAPFLNNMQVTFNTDMNDSYNPLFINLMNAASINAFWQQRISAMKGLLVQYYGYCDSDQRLSARDLGDKHYEFTNHLGNVLVVVSDKSIPQISGGVINYFDPEIISISDYYPFGMSYQPKPCEGRQISERSQSAPNLNYRYGFNSKEEDNEVSGQGNSLDYGARMYASRLGRWFSVDLESKCYPNLSPYSYVANMPIQAIDPSGKLIIFINGAPLGDMQPLAPYWTGYDQNYKIDWVSALEKHWGIIIQIFMMVRLEI